MIKILFITVLTVVSLIANEVKTDTKLRVFVLADQFGAYHTVDRHVKTIIVSSQKDISAEINSFLASKSSTYLKDRDAVYIANISKMPAIITKMFAMPKLKEFKHKILLINDETDKRFTTKDEKITVYKLQDSVVKNILYLNTIEEVEKLL